MIKIGYLKLALLAALLWMSGSGLCYASDINKGAQVYATHCASCHGLSGISVMLGAPSFAKNEGLMSPDNALLVSIRSGKAAMPAYRGVLSDQDILNVIAYLRTMN